jgi:hypothetical protein
MTIDVNDYPSFRSSIMSMINECDQVLQSPNYSDALKGQKLGAVVLKYTA